MKVSFLLLNDGSLLLGIIPRHRGIFGLADTELHLIHNISKFYELITSFSETELHTDFYPLDPTTLPSAIIKLREFNEIYGKNPGRSGSDYSNRILLSLFKQNDMVSQICDVCNATEALVFLQVIKGLLQTEVTNDKRSPWSHPAPKDGYWNNIPAKDFYENSLKISILIQQRLDRNKSSAEIKGEQEEKSKIQEIYAKAVKEDKLKAELKDFDSLINEQQALHKRIDHRIYLGIKTGKDAKTLLQDVSHYQEICNQLVAGKSKLALSFAANERLQGYINEMNTHLSMYRLSSSYKNAECALKPSFLKGLRSTIFGVTETQGSDQSVPQGMRGQVFVFGRLNNSV